MFVRIVPTSVLHRRPRVLGSMEATTIVTRGGFENLDFLGNVGHSIATRREDRQYIEAKNMRLLKEVPFFTFEPHVREVGGMWGFKHENIFYFNQDGCVELL